MSWCRRPHRCLATVANAAMSARSASGEANPQRAAARRRICSCCRVYQAGSVADGLLHIRAGTCAGSGCVDFQQPVRSRVAGGGWRWCGRNVKTLCAYSDTHLWCLRRTCRLGALSFLSVLSLPPLASRPSRVFCQQRWCRFVFRSASPPLC